MRDLLVLTLVGVGALAALRRPWIGVLLWTWLSIMNPHRLTYGVAYAAPLALIAAMATVAGLLFTRERQSPFQGAPTWWLLVLAAWITISWLMGVDLQGQQPMWERVMKIFFMTFVALALLVTKQRIIAFACVTLGSLAVLSVKGGIFTLATGGQYRVWGPPDSFIEGNNEFALATVVAIPMLHFLQLQLPKRWMRYAMTVPMLLCVAAAVGSYSRGALLALVAMGVVFWWRGRHKVLIGGLIVVAAIALSALMPAEWWGRMQTINEYNDDESAMGRINAWLVAWRVAQTHFFGAGMSYQYAAIFNEYGTYENIVRAAHSIYFEILGNHGVIGLALYLALWISAYRSAGWLRKNAAKLDPAAKWAADLGAMAQASIASFAVGGAFLSLSYFDLPYNILVMIVLTRQWVERRAWELERRAPEPASNANQDATPVRDERPARARSFSATLRTPTKT
jgi:putative inorganic carbon (hco3(-)) transporter